MITEHAECVECGRVCSGKSDWIGWEIIDKKVYCGSCARFQGLGTRRPWSPAPSFLSRIVTKRDQGDQGDQGGQRDQEAGTQRLEGLGLNHGEEASRSGTPGTPGMPRTDGEEAAT